MSKTATRPQPNTGALDPNPIRAHVLRKCTSMGSGQTASGEEACAYAQIRNFKHVAVSISRESLSTHA